MSYTGVLNPDVIWLVLHYAAYSDNLWDYRTLKACCHVSREWYSLAKRILYRFIVLWNRQQVRILQQTRGKHLQIRPDASPRGPGYDVPPQEDIWEAQTRIVECHWSGDLLSDDIRHALSLFPSLYEVRVKIHLYERPWVNQDVSSLPMPSTIQALRLTGSVGLEEYQNNHLASYFISVLSKYARIHCLQCDGIWITPDLRFPKFLQSIPIHELTYLEFDIMDQHEDLTGDLFDNLLYLVLHQKLAATVCVTLKHLYGVFKKVKSLTVFHYAYLSPPERVPQLSRLPEMFPALTELRLGLRLSHLQYSVITPLFSRIPSGLISLSLFIAANPYKYTHTETTLAETEPWEDFTIPPTLRYFEYGLGSSTGAECVSVMRPFLEACESMGVQILPSQLHDITDVVSITITLLTYCCSLTCRLRK